jgi:hypothetical protein
MAQIFQLNGSSLTYPTKAFWTDQSSGSILNGKTPIHRWRDHLWRAEVMTETEYNTLYAQNGQRINITTIDYNDRNGDYKTYYQVKIMSVSGSHNGPIFEGVEVRFKVRV